MTWWALCPGEDLSCCRSCLRLADNHPPQPFTHPRITPHTQDGKCIDHRGIPDREPVKRHISVNR